MFYFLVVLIAMASADADYWAEREKFIQDERDMALGAGLELNENEEKVNHLLMKYKRNEFEDGFHNPALFPPSMHFFKAKEYLDKSLVFSILKQMPKGAILHTHDFAVLQPEWIVKNVTYRENLYYYKEGDKWNFKFTNNPKEKDWLLVEELRNHSVSVQEFDKNLKKLLSLEVPDPETQYPDINSVWKRFMELFSTITPMLTYRPVFEDYFNEVLEQSYSNNVMYIEMRGTLPDVYELDGTLIKGKDSVKIMEDINTKFRQRHPDHMGMKFIYAPPRHVDNETMDSYVKDYVFLKNKHPNFIAGFDLVGQEDMGKPLIDFVNDLKKFTNGTKFFFHAGETDWYGMSTDKNLVDAVLLNTTRIGHGYAIVKHPKVMEEIKKRDIAIEVNPISNQVLLLVKDIRNHPASILASQNFPIVVSCDDPGYWGANFLEHDFYFAFMGFASCDDDLRFLKQLVLNSLKYSVFTEEERIMAMNIFEKQWDAFLLRILEQHDIPIVNSNNVN